jgi:hypothetical protein
MKSHRATDGKDCSLPEPQRVHHAPSIMGLVGQLLSLSLARSGLALASRTHDPFVSITALITTDPGTFGAPWAHRSPAWSPSPNVVE